MIRRRDGRVGLRREIKVFLYSHLFVGEGSNPSFVNLLVAASLPDASVNFSFILAIFFTV